jgi:NitT/TauT family transport system ATP-binding protein
MIQINNLHHSFKNNNQTINVLKDISFNIEWQNFISIVGPSGCGKTTLVNILAGYLKNNGGEIYINNKKINKPGKDRVIINQENDLFEWMTVEENIKFGAKNKENVDKYLEIVGLTNFKDHYPYQISGGMKKKTAIGRALAAEGDFIIMDEPFSSLDYQYREKIHDELLYIWQKTKKTILLITHDIEEAIYLSNKIIVFSDRPATIKETMEINLGYPRNYKIKNSQGFIELKNKIRELI